MKSEIVQNQMNHLSIDDSTSELSEKINDSMAIMDLIDNSNTVREKKVHKSITLNLEAQPPTPVSKSLNPREIPKGILKKTENNVMLETGRAYYQTLEQENLTAKPIPHDLDELVDIEGLVPTTIGNTFSLEDLSDDDEVWLMDIPKRINPELLNGQILSLTNKTKLKLGKESYIAIYQEVKGVLPCVFSTEKGSTSYKLVNIKPTGMIQLKQKVTSVPKSKSEYSVTKIPLLPNIRHRDPLHGVDENNTDDADETNIKVENETRKKK